MDEQNPAAFDLDDVEPVEIPPYVRARLDQQFARMRDEQQSR